MAPLAAALLRALAQEPPDRDVSLPRLGKRLGQGASVLLRQLSLMGDAPWAACPAPAGSGSGSTRAAGVRG